MAGAGQGASVTQACLMLLFEPGARPSAGASRSALGKSAFAQVSYDPSEGNRAGAANDWLEVVADGLTFDLLGIAPGRALSLPQPRHRFAIPARPGQDFEAVGIAPGPHLSGAHSAMPVVRTLLRIGMAFTHALDGLAGAQWLPAATAMSREVFVKAVGGWLAGGPFPALGLTGIVELSDGALVSDGLAFFTGQEIALDRALCRDRREATRLLVRLIDRFAEQPPLAGEERIALEDGGSLRLVAGRTRIAVMPG